MGHEVEVMAGPPYPNVAPGIRMHRLESLRLYDSPYEKVNKSPSLKLSSLFTPLNFYEWATTQFGVFPEPFTFSIRAYQKLLKLNYKFDIVHDNQCLGYGLLLMKRRETPVVATIHHPIPIDREAHLAQARNLKENLQRRIFYSFCTMQRIVAQRLDRVINVSQASAQETQRAFNIPQSKLRVVYNGVDTESFRNQDGVLKEPNSLIMVGSTEDRKKGILYLLKAMQILKDAVKVKLTIVDRKPPDTQYAPQLVKEHGLEDRVTFTGRLSVAELARCYSAAEIAVTPSLYEGFGFPPAEAMACGLPVITTRGGALPEVVGEDSEAGILVPPADPLSLAAAIKQLLADEPLRRKMGEAGRKRIERLFTWQEAAKKTVEVYQEVL